MTGIVRFDELPEWNSTHDASVRRKTCHERLRESQEFHEVGRVNCQNGTSNVQTQQSIGDPTEPVKGTKSRSSMNSR
jgi:hypothetical protein